MNLEENTFRFLNDLEISLAEHFVMCSVSYEIYLPIEKLAQQTFRLVEGDLRGNFSIEEYAKAIEDCIERDLLIVVTSEICNLLFERKKQKSLHYPLEIGDIIFTQKGFQIFRKSIEKILGEDVEKQLPLCWCY